MAIIRKRRYSWRTQLSQDHTIESISNMGFNKQYSVQTKKTKKGTRFFIRKKLLLIEMSLLSPVFCGEVRQALSDTKVSGKFAHSTLYRVITGVMWTVISIISIVCFFVYFSGSHTIPAVEFKPIENRWLLIAIPFFWYMALSFLYLLPWILQKKRRVEIISLIEQAVAP